MSVRCAGRALQEHERKPAREYIAPLFSAMNVTALVNAKPPESYNQDYWLCLYQRNAWLLQRWLQTGNPFIFLEEKGTPLILTAEPGLSVLLQKKEKYVVRYVEESYWVLWEAEGYCFILKPHRFYPDKDNSERFFPQTSSSEQCKRMGLALQRLLVLLHTTNTLPTSLMEFATEGDLRMANPQEGCMAVQGEGCVVFSSPEKCYTIPYPVILDWHFSKF
jgi:hypothetical protein